jgi:selenocysteine-specific elongation factor
MTTDLILGTAGHIDHGKTALVRALTGVDTDRLPEEKRRGITIELGFAELLVGDFRLGIVDVPGHERFVRNMLAGATGMDLAMLVVAADDSVKPQTREHFEILRLLDLRAGVIVITKCDLAEPGWLNLVEDEVRELVSGSFLSQSPLVRTSTVTGQGLDALRDELAKAASRAAARRMSLAGRAPFRMAIDRMFTIAGHGTVVTGSVSSGGASVGDELSIEPGGKRVRVRGLHNHDRAVNDVQRGQRAAINLAGVHHDELMRGQELCSPGHLVPSRVLTASLTMLNSMSRPCRDRTRVRLHVGTAELTATLRLLGRDRLQAGESGPVQFFLGRPAVTVWGQPFVVRAESPSVTIGGGIVLDPNAERIRAADDETLSWVERLRSTDETVRASAALYFAGLRDWVPLDLSRTAGIEEPDRVASVLRERGDLREIVVSPTRAFRVHQRAFERLCQRLEVALGRLHERHPLRTMHDRNALFQGLRYAGEDAVLAAALQFLRSQGRVVMSDRGVALVGHGPRLSQNERKSLQQLIDVFRNHGISTPSIEECQRLISRSQASLPQLLALAVENQDLVEIAQGYYLHADSLRAVREQLTRQLAGSEGLTLSQIREMLNTTRKYAVPLCEYFDRIGFTERRGDLRILNTHSPS